MNLRLDWCSHEAAAFAVRHWHYSGTMPAGKAVYIGVWEDGTYIGTVIFALGANHHMAQSVGVGSLECAELVRVALRSHRAPVSRILAIAITLLRRQSPGLRMIVSYADPREGHHGGIYQAGNWLYLGQTPVGTHYTLHGRLLHKRGFTGRTFGKAKRPVPPGALRVKTPGKHKYAMPLDAAARTRITPLVKPYPLRVRSTENGAPAPTGGGGVIPTRTLPR